jgi:hypothetical protein
MTSEDVTLCCIPLEIELLATTPVLCSTENLKFGMEYGFSLRKRRVLPEVVIFQNRTSIQPFKRKRPFSISEI